MRPSDETTDQDHQVDWLTVEEVESELGLVSAAWSAEAYGAEGHRYEETGRLSAVIVEFTAIPANVEPMRYGDGADVYEEPGGSLSGNAELWISRRGPRSNHPPLFDWWTLGAQPEIQGSARSVTTAICGAVAALERNGLGIAR